MKKYFTESLVESSEMKFARLFRLGEIFVTFSML